jgi:hypothetical protein
MHCLGIVIIINDYTRFVLTIMNIQEYNVNKGEFILGYLPY